MKRRAAQRFAACMLSGAVLLFLVLLTGCWDAKEVQRLSYITGLGVDYENHKFVIYAQMVNFAAIAKEEQQNAKVKTWVGQGKGSTVLAAINDLMSTVSGTMFLGHVNFLILTENVFKEQMLEKVFDFTNRNKETRYTKWFYGTRGSLFDLLSAKSFFDRSSLDSQLGDPEQNYAQLSNLKPYYVNEIVAGMLEPSSTVVIPSMELTDQVWREQNKPMPIFKKSGGFIFNGTQYAGWMKMSDIMQGRWLQSAYQASPLTLRKNHHSLATIEVKDATHQIEIHEQAGHPRFKVKLRAKGTIMELAEPMPLEEIERLAEQTVRNEIMAYYKKGLAMQADLVRLGQTYYRYHPARWKKLSVNGRLPLEPSSLEAVDVELLINHAQKYKSPQVKDTYR